jgi:hypothetical protein
LAAHCKNEKTKDALLVREGADISIAGKGDMIATDGIQLAPQSTSMTMIDLAETLTSKDALSLSFLLFSQSLLVGLFLFKAKRPK